MKDIKTLYLAAKSSGKPADISAYTEAIQDLIDNNPAGYISQLEYIISSDIGLKTVKPFIEKNGFPIICYDQIIDVLNECIHKCEVYKKDSSIYTEAISEFEQFHKDHIHCFMMFENFRDQLKDNYVSAYYGKTQGGHQNRKLIAGLINRFGEAAIPDALITADSMDSTAVKTVLEYTATTYGGFYRTIYEWLLTVSDDLKPENRPNELLQEFKEKSLTHIVNRIKDREHQAFRESVILDSNPLIEYSLDDINSIRDLITFKEYQMTWLDELNKSHIDYQKEIYSLYEMLDGIIDEETDEVIDESLAVVNTRNKKTGEIPRYLSTNHNLDYGEENPSKKKEPTLDDYRRPSASSNTSTSSSPLLPSAYDNKEDKEPNVSSNSTGLSDHDQRVINNYYYNYTNSLNKNTNSYNRDQSVSNDNSKIINHINSHNNSHNRTLLQNDDENDEPASLDIFDEFESINESTHFFFDEDQHDKSIKSKWFIKSDDNAENCCISLSGYTKPLRGRSVVVVLKEENGKYYAMIKRKPNGQYEFPGGGWDKNETPEKAGIRELNEEAQVKAKNVKRIGTQIQYNDKDHSVSPWVRKHVSDKNDWWYGYYTAIFVGMYDGEFKGHISEEDREDTFKWKPLDFIKRKIPAKYKSEIVKYITDMTGDKFNESYVEELFNNFNEAVDVTNKKFDKGYKAVFDYDTGHMLKLTYSLQDCEITNVGMSKAVRDTIGKFSEDINRENHRGSRHTKHIRAFIVLLKGIIGFKKNINERKKFITNFLNKYIGDVGYLDFQAKNAKIIEIYDLYEKKVISDEVRTVGIFAARWMESGKRNILNEADLAKVHKLLKDKSTKFHIAKFKVGDVDKYPTFMSTYWDDKDDHLTFNIGNTEIESDKDDRKLDSELDNIPDIIGDLELKGFHINDAELDNFLKRYRDDKFGDAIIDKFGENVSKPWELNVFEDIYINEGIRDLFRKAVNKVKGIIGAKKTIANLQKMDTPEFARRRLPLTIPGTNIPLGNKNLKTESFNDIEYTDDIEKLLEAGYIITEDAESAFLSKNDVKNIVNKLRSKFNADIYFISSNSNPAIVQTIGPAACIRTTREYINKLVSGKDFDNIPSEFYGNREGLETVILVNTKIIRDFNIKSPHTLELLLSHEYGHVLTYDQISAEEWFEYTIKRQLLGSILYSLYPDQDMDITNAETNLIYYKLKPEKLANEAGGNIDPVKLTEAIFGITPKGNLNKINVDAFVSWKFDPVIISMAEKSAKGVTDFSKEEMIANLTATSAAYKTIITDNESLKMILEQIESTKSFYENYYSEAVGDADDNKPKSDHPVKDTLMDIDRELMKGHQKVKKGVQDIQNAGRAAMKPVNRTKSWINKLISDWKDMDENKMKERMADPKTRNGILSAVTWSIKTGSLLKAGILLNPYFAVISLLGKYGKNKRELRLRNEMIGELKTEISIIDEKIKDADHKGDNAAKYKLMRLKNELNKKLIRVGGTRAMRKMI